MRILLSSPGWSCGAVAALFVATAASPSAAQGGGVGGVRAGARNDSVVVRVVDAALRARLESLTVFSRALDEATPGSARAVELRAQMESMWTALRSASTVGAFGPGGRGMARIMITNAQGMRQFEASRMFNGWIGVTAASSLPQYESIRNDNYFIRYFAYPSVVSVEPNSPAQRAGIEPGDLLVAYDGTDVVAHEINVTQTFVPDRKLSVTVRREGENRDYAMTVEKAPPRIFLQRVEPIDVPGVPTRIGGRFESPANTVTLRSRPSAASGQQTFDVVAGALIPGRGIYQTDGVFGASMLTLKPELATVLRLESGVIVDQVPEDTPAYRSGLKVGDIIVNVAGMAVSNVRDIRVVVQTRQENRSILLQIIRDKKAKQLTVKW